MDKFFAKYKAHLGEKHAIDTIIRKAKKVKKYYDENEDYEECLKELSEMIDDFFEAKESE